MFREVFYCRCHALPLQIGRGDFTRKSRKIRGFRCNSCKFQGRSNRLELVTGGSPGQNEVLAADQEFSEFGLIRLKISHEVTTCRVPESAIQPPV